VGKQHIGVGNVCIWCDQPMPCREILLDEHQRLLQRSRDEDTARIRLNHARIEAEAEVARLQALLAERDAAVARAERAEAARVDLVGLLDEFFHGEESAAFCERPGGLVCIDCGMAAREDVADIDHEDGCRVGALYAALAAASEDGGV